MADGAGHAPDFAALPPNPITNTPGPAATSAFDSQRGTMHPCTHCPAPAVRDVATTSLCGEHLARLYATFAPAVWWPTGSGLPTSGALRAEYGPSWADLACNACGATWVGLPGDPCNYCRRTHAALLEHQADLVLEPPDVHPDDREWQNVMTGWAARLAVAVDAGLITEHQAERALRQGLAA